MQIKLLHVPFPKVFVICGPKVLALMESVNVVQ